MSWRWSLITACAVVVAFPMRSYAASPDFLIGDREFTDSATMSLADVQRFFEERGSLLATTYLPDSSGALKFPSEILWFAAVEARVNPQVLLATLQKEQRLVTDTKPTVRQYDYAMGYGCPDGSGCSDRFRGFGKQIRGAALQFRGYLDDLTVKGETIARWAVGRAKETGDGFTVTPQNAATAALYSYTPWRGNGKIGGNTSFVRIWKEWFGGGTWPDGTVLEAPDGSRWLLQGNKRRKFASRAVAAARASAAAIVSVRQEELETYTEGSPIRFAEYAVVEGPDRKRWVLVGDTRRPIASAAVFRQLGFHPEEVEGATVDDLSAYRVGEPITAAGGNPRGVLIRERESKRVYHIVEGVKRLVSDDALRTLVFSDATVVVKPAKDLKKYRTGEPVRLPEGVIVTAPNALPTVFIISKGERRPIASPRALELLGYQWSDVVHVSNATLALHPVGALVGDGNGNGSAVAAPTARVTPPPQPAVSRPPQHGLSIF